MIIIIMIKPYEREKGEKERESSIKKKKNLTEHEKIRKKKNNRKHQQILLQEYVQEPNCFIGRHKQLIKEKKSINLKKKKKKF